MTLRIYLLIASLFVVNNTLAQKQIRNANWGMSKTSVKASETLTLFAEEPTKLSYSGVLGGKEFDIVYKFIDNKLTSVYYVYAQQHSNKKSYVDAYYEVKRILTTKYDYAIVDKIDWTNELFKDRESDWGLACALGHVSFYSGWANEDARISLLLHGENNNASLIIMYNSIRYADLIDEQKSQQNMKDF